MCARKPQNLATGWPRVRSITPSSSGKACARRAEENVPNKVGARTQPCFTPLQIGKVLDMALGPSVNISCDFKIVSHNSQQRYLKWKKHHSKCLLFIVLFWNCRFSINYAFQVHVTAHTLFVNVIVIYLFSRHPSWALSYHLLL